MKSIVERAKQAKKRASSVGETSFPDFQDELIEALLDAVECLGFYADQINPLHREYMDGKYVGVGEKARAALRKLGVGE